MEPPNVNVMVGALNADIEQALAATQELIDAEAWLAEGLGADKAAEAVRIARHMRENVIALRDAAQEAYER